jgi:hypothetical protein
MIQLKITDYCFVIGVYDKDIYIEDQKIIKLNSNDYYEGLSKKIIKAFKFIYNNDF